MSKSKSKPQKKAAPQSGMVVKTSNTSKYAKPSSVVPGKNFSSSKKGAMLGTPRKAG